MYSWDVFLFSTIIASDVQIKTKVSDSWYDLVVKGQGHTYLELVYGLNATSSFIFWPSVNIKLIWPSHILKTCQIARNTNILIYFDLVFIFATIFAYHMLIAPNVSEYIYDLQVKGQSQIFLKICLTAHNTNSAFMHWWNAFILSTMIAYEA